VVASSDIDLSLDVEAIRPKDLERTGVMEYYRIASSTTPPAFAVAFGRGPVLGRAENQRFTGNTSRSTPMGSPSQSVTSPRRRTAWARNLAAPVRDFLATESGGAVALVTATVVALLWANSPWSSSYESVWTTDLAIRLEGRGYRSTCVSG